MKIHAIWLANRDDGYVRPKRASKLAELCELKPRRRG
jgi:hypothetical protein